MQLPTDAVPAPLPHHTHALGLDEILNGRADVVQICARLCGFDADVEGLLRHLQQTLGLLRDLPHRVGDAGVAAPAP